MISEPNPKPLSLYKYVNFNVGESIITTNYLRFNSPQNFNDPFDCDISRVCFDLKNEESISDKVKADIELLEKEFPVLKRHPKRTQLLEKGYEESQIDKITKSSVTCFSVDGNQELMWAHYADSHKGICLEFDNHDGNFKSSIEIESAASGPVIYESLPIFNYCEDKKEGLARIFFIKPKIWAYEKEYRMVAFNSEGLYRFDQSRLKSVTFGLRVTNVDIRRVLEYTNRLNIGNVIFKKATIQNDEIMISQI